MSSDPPALPLTGLLHDGLQRKVIKKNGIIKKKIKIGINYILLMPILIYEFKFCKLT